MSTTDYDDVTKYPLDPEVREELLTLQNEASFCWGTRDHSPMGVIMTYVWRDGRFWFTATSQRARIHAVRRDPRVTVIVSSVGTKLGPAKSITAKGQCTIRTDRATQEWVYRDVAAAIIPGADEFQKKFVQMMDTERRVVLEVNPEKWITFDAEKMMRDSLFPPG
jgi:general stress protein 26